MDLHPYNTVHHDITRHDIPSIKFHSSENIEYYCMQLQLKKKINMCLFLFMKCILILIKFNKLT
jgi:hypothetical protein